jgi:hypothetical protein
VHKELEKTSKKLEKQKQLNVEHKKERIQLQEDVRRLQREKD